MRIKTAISIEEDLFNQAEKLSKELGVTRSGLFAMGLKAMIERRENQRLLERLNQELEKIYPDPEEEEHIGRIKAYHRKRLTGR